MNIDFVYISSQLQRIIEDVKKAELDPPVSVLTGDHRDSWTVVRIELLVAFWWLFESNVFPSNTGSRTLVGYTSKPCYPY